MINRSLSEIARRDDVTEEIYCSADGKLRIHLRLLRKQADETIWLKFIHKTLFAKSSYGFGIAVDTFQSFADFLGAALHHEDGHDGPPARIPFSTWIILAIKEGVSQPAFLGEYRSKKAPHVVIRLFAFTNRRCERRVVFEHKTSTDDAYEVFDSEVLSMIQGEIKNNQG